MICTWHKLCFIILGVMACLGAKAQETEYPLSDTTDAIIYRDGQNYILHNEPMRGEVYASFLKNHCTEAYEKYQSGYKTSIAGWTLFGCGTGIELVTMIYGLCSFNQGSIYELLVALIGGTIVTASVPTLIVGYVKMHKSADIYNHSCSNQKYWSIHASQNGLGVAYHF